MKKAKIYWKDAIVLLKQGKEVAQLDIDFRDEQIPVQEVGFMNKHKLRVPENLVSYDDEKIDCSDIPEITSEDLQSGRIQWIKTDEFALDEETRSWIVRENIKLNELIPQLLRNFYQTVKSIKNNAAL